MADTAPIYKRLPGRGAGILARTSLWEGPDHLLLVTAWPGGESYRRFFFRDIQSIVVRRTARRLWVNVILFVLMLATAGPMFYFAADDGEMSVAGVAFAAVFGLFILITSLLGPTCETRFQTAVQTERISSLNRVRTATRALARIQPRILEAQSEPAPAQPAA